MPTMAYPGSVVQQNYAEDTVHGYLQWNIQSRDQYDVKFSKLPNPKPFVTIDWAGDVDKTYELAKKNPVGSRFRIKSYGHIVQHDIQELTSVLKQSMLATEVTFKIDQQFSRNTFTNGTQTLVRADLRNPDVLLGLIRNYHPQANYDADVWTKVGDHVRAYITTATQTEDIVRNTKWSLKSLKFDNLFSYGEGNTINFDSLNGIVGIFGNNRAGKSSIVGSIMYSLFNTTDRGSLKNLHICNVRKPFCYSRAIVNISGVDYVFERQTTKHENKRGVVSASTALNVFKIDEHGEAQDLAGEQRNDTEKVIRSLIGNADDFLLTSLSAQGEINQFIEQGSTRRRQILSRFLDLDIFDKMYDLSSKDVNVAKIQLKTLPDKDWSMVVEKFKNDIKDISEKIESKSNLHIELAEKLSDAKTKLASHKDITPVTKAQVENIRLKVNQLSSQVDRDHIKMNSFVLENEKSFNKIKTIDELRKEYDLVNLKLQLTELNELESTQQKFKHLHDKEMSVLHQHERSLKILNEVPCGDQFLSCKFIKDAHESKEKLETQREKTVKTLEKFEKASANIKTAYEKDLVGKIEKIEKLNDLYSKMKIDTSNNEVEIVKLESAINTNTVTLDESKTRLVELELALKNDENAEVVSLRSIIDELSGAISRTDSEKMTLASSRGKIISDAEKLLEEKKVRETILQKMKLYELVSSAFSKKGIPNVIVTSQLPLINAEISKILAGIVDFSIELEADEESDSMEIYINYGDSRRVIELASGMEKMIASIAIRVALITISTLPKTDMFILDEGFGALDDAGVEACNQLLISLKRYFKTVVVITHVDGVKDAADVILDITKNENDARVVYDLC